MLPTWADALEDVASNCMGLVMVAVAVAVTAPTETETTDVLAPSVVTGVIMVTWSAPTTAALVEMGGVGMGVVCTSTDVACVVVGVASVVVGVVVRESVVKATDKGGCCTSGSWTLGSEQVAGPTASDTGTEVHVVGEVSGSTTAVVAGGLVKEGPGEGMASGIIVSSWPLLPLLSSEVSSCETLACSTGCFPSSSATGFFLPRYSARLTFLTTAILSPSSGEMTPPRCGTLLAVTVSRLPPPGG